MGMIIEDPNPQLRILFVEDDIEQAEGLRRLISKKMPNQVDAWFETTLRGGVDRSKEILPCVVFLDLLLPDANFDWRVSAEAIDQMHGAIIVVTELDSIEVEIACRKAGALMVFNKSKIPSIVEVVVHVITNIRLNALARSPKVAEK